MSWIRFDYIPGRRGLALLLLPLLASCMSFRDPLPAGWQASVPPDDLGCSAIAGTYESRGESGQGSRAPYLILEMRKAGPNLRWDFGAAESLSLDASDRVSIEAGEGAGIGLALWDGDTRVLSARPNPEAQGFSCEAGWLRIRSSRWERARIDTVLSLARRGDFLIVGIREDLVTLSMPPVSLSFETWSRYRRR